MRTIDQPVIEEAVRLLLGAAPPGSKVILFGSHARGTADARSDLDLMVIEPETKDPFAEAVRLRRVLGPLRIPIDLLVESQKDFDYWRDTPNTIQYRALAEGRLYESMP
jgi:predicted nucleotidyltransferase